LRPKKGEATRKRATKLMLTKESRQRSRDLTPASLFPQEFGWIDGKRSQGWNGGRCDAQQRHC
jgi:hypothetical protein